MLNSVVLVGRAGQNAGEGMKYFESGKVRTVFNLAVNRPVRRGDGRDVTDWFRIELWGRTAEIAGEYVRKGSLVGILGRLEIQSWTDSNGTKHTTPVIAASQLKLLGGRGDIQEMGEEDVF
jgi:single-strand DNA-binding protein